MRRAPAAALLAALVCVTALGLRTLTTNDLGYHLAYGERFLDTGRIVDHNAFVYTLPSPHTSPGQRPAPGPGCWYDGEGRYRFPNANWLSQIVMASADRLAGTGGLCALNMLLVGTLSALLAATMGRLGVSATVSAAGLLLFGVVSFSRLDLRPELFGDVALALEMFLMSGTAAGIHQGAILRWRTVAAVLTVQVLFVNLHSYFLLGFLLAGTLLADGLIRWTWLRLVRGAAEANALRKTTLRLGVLQGGMAAVCLVNPWGWRLAVLPVQTLVYLKANGIGGGKAGAHPWSNIAELRETIRSGFPSGVWGYGFLLLLVLACAGCLGALLRRRPWLLLAIAGMTTVSLSMRRNVAAGALVIVPAALAGIQLLRPARAREADVWRRLERPAAAIAVAAAFGFGVAILTSRFYKSEGYPTRFGIGISSIEIPLGAAAWLDEHLPGKRVWCDFGNSSNLHFFTRPHRDVPILTNTWAYPPAVMADNRSLRQGDLPFDPVAEQGGVDAVLLNRLDSLTLVLELSGNPRWAVVQIEGRNLLFIRSTGDQGDLARRSSRLLKDVDTDALIARYSATDPFLDEALLPVGQSLAVAGLLDQSLAVLQRVVDERPKDEKAWRHLGAAYAARASRRQHTGDPGFRQDLELAQRCFQKAGRPSPDLADGKGLPED